MSSSPLRSDRQPTPENNVKEVGTQPARANTLSTSLIAASTAVRSSHQDSVREAVAEEQLSCRTIHPGTRAQLHLPPLHLPWDLSATRQSIQVCQPSSTSLLFISPGICQQQDSPSRYASPAPPPSSSSPLGSVSNKTVHRGMPAQLHLPPLHLPWDLSATRQSIQVREPSSTSLLFISPGISISTAPTHSSDKKIPSES